MVTCIDQKLNNTKDHAEEKIGVKKKEPPLKREATPHRAKHKQQRSRKSKRLLKSPETKKDPKLNESHFTPIENNGAKEKP